MSIFSHSWIVEGFRRDGARESGEREEAVDGMDCVDEGADIFAMCLLEGSWD
jgi:hypothetical protein